tara:strand:+ start:932 stop:1387 length:456 start_codon:yes stop_codon:yes gene_type:complete
MVFISPLGPLGIKAKEEKIIKLKFDTNTTEVKPKTSFLKEVHYQLNLYFNNKLRKFDIPYVILATAYQKNVLLEVKKISFGDTKTYSDIASKIQSHARPVGNACRNNPIQLLIPCHRVIGKNNLGGFSGDDIRKNGNMFFIKKKLLELEDN